MTYPHFHEVGAKSFNRTGFGRSYGNYRMSPDRIYGKVGKLRSADTGIQRRYLWCTKRVKSGGTGAPLFFTGGPLNITGAPLYFTGTPLYLPVDC